MSVTNNREIAQIHTFENNDTHSGKHKESPSLSLIIEEDKNNVNIQQLTESIISALRDGEDVRIFHLKSDFGLETVSKRINQQHLLPYIYMHRKELNT